MISADWISHLSGAALGNVALSSDQLQVNGAAAEAEAATSLSVLEDAVAVAELRHASSQAEAQMIDAYRRSLVP